MNASMLAARLRALMAERGPLPAEAAEMARQWALLLADALDRLERAVSWAAKGLRSEAIALVRMAPSVYETAMLSWDPTLAGWDDFCRRHRLERPPVLLRDTLDRLNECTLQLEPIQTALARWRKLNIGRAPATERLDQMRTLRALDPDNPIWIDDAPSLERAALDEVTGACERALALWELDRVSNAIRWLESGRWLHAPASAAATALRARVRDLSGRSALERAKGVVARLHAEYMAESIDAAQERLAEWEALRAFLAESGVDLPADLIDSVRPVVEWIRERQEASQRLLEHRTRESELRALVESPAATLGALESLLATLDTGPSPIDARLRAAAKRRIGDLRRIRTVRRVLLTAACLLAAAVLLLSALWIVDRHQQRVREEQFLASVDAAVARDDLESIDAMIDRALAEEPRLGEGGAPVEARRRLANAFAERLRNDATFERGLAEAGDPADPSASDSAVAALDALARTAEQRARLDEWRHAHRRAEAARQQARDLAFVDALAEIEGGLAELAAAASIGVGNSAEAEAQEEARADARNPDSKTTRLRAETESLERLRLRLDALEASPGISPPALARAKPVRLRLETMAQARSQALALERARAEEALEIESILRRLHDPHDLAAHLRRFGEGRPESVHAQGFLDAALDEPAWRAIQAWPSARSVIRAPIAALDEPQRVEARRALRAYAESHPRSIHAEAARKALPYLEPAGDWRRWFASVLDASPLFTLRSLQLQNGDRYYYEETSLPQSLSDGQRVYRVVTRLRDPAKRAFDSEHLRIERHRIRFDGDSPQRDLARTIRASLRAGELDGVEGLLLTIQLIRDSGSVDAVLRAHLIAGLLERLAHAAPPLAPLTALAVRRLAEQQLDRIEWLDPRSLETLDRSREIDAMLPRLIETQRWTEAWRTGARSADLALAATLEPVGLLLLVDGEGGREARFAGKPVEGDLVVVRAADANGVDRWRVVGRVHADGSVTLDHALTKSIPSGTPLFQWRESIPEGPSGGARP